MVEALGLPQQLHDMVTRVSHRQCSCGELPKTLQAPQTLKAVGWTLQSQGIASRGATDGHGALQRNDRR
jgi:hypothetical protein